MDIGWQEVPSGTIRVTPGGAIETDESENESLTPIMPNEAVRLYVVFTESDTVTLEQQVEALAETVELSVRRYDKTGHAAVIQTTAGFISKIEKSPDVISVTRETEAELQGSMTGETGGDAEDFPKQTVSYPVQSESDKPAASESGHADETEETASEDKTASEVESDNSEETAKKETGAGDTEGSEADKAEETAKADAGEELTQSVKIAKDDSENDTQGIFSGVNEQTTLTAETLVTSGQADTGHTGSSVVFAVLGGFIILVVAFLFIRRR